MLDNKYYVYRHIRLDTNEPFYIGLGTKRNKKYKSYQDEYYRAFQKTYRNSFWQKIINKTDFIVEILFENNDYLEIQIKEQEFIKLYGRRNIKTGILCNLTDGGDGSRGINPSKETRLKMSKITKSRDISTFNHHKMCKPIVQYDLEGNFIKEYSSIKKCAEETGFSKSGINNCALGKSKLLFGNIFCFKDKGFYKKEIKTNKGCKIKLMDVVNNTEEIFSSTRKISEKYNIPISTCKSCLQGRAKSIYNRFKLEYVK